MITIKDERCFVPIKKMLNTYFESDREKIYNDLIESFNYYNDLKTNNQDDLYLKFQNYSLFYSLSKDEFTSYNKHNDSFLVFNINFIKRSHEYSIFNFGKIRWG